MRVSTMCLPPPKARTRPAALRRVRAPVRGLGREARRARAADAELERREVGLAKEGEEEDVGRRETRNRTAPHRRRVKLVVEDRVVAKGRRRVERVVRVSAEGLHTSIERKRMLHEEVTHRVTGMSLAPAASSAARRSACRRSARPSWRWGLRAAGQGAGSATSAGASSEAPPRTHSARGWRGRR